MKKIGLIIQGPLLSVGKDGARAHIPKVVLGEEGFVRYDCRPNIQKIIDDFGPLFEAIVVSTWDSEVKPGDGWAGAALVSMPDPGEIQRETYNFRSRNKFRQFVGIGHGVSELKKLADIEYVVRIRTDQYVDLAKLVGSFFAVTDGSVRQAEAIGVPFTRPADFFTHDLYFMSSVAAMEAFCSAVLAFNQYEFISCVHRDLLLKYAYGAYRGEIAVSDFSYFPRWPASGASAPTKRIFDFMFKRVFTSLSPEVYRAVQWRGTMLSREHTDAQYQGAGVKKNIIDVPALASVDWRRYFQFLQETAGRPASVQDAAVVAAGRVAWRAWGMARSVASRMGVTRAIYRLVR